MLWKEMPNEDSQNLGHQGPLPSVLAWVAHKAEPSPLISISRDLVMTKSLETHD